MLLMQSFLAMILILCDSQATGMLTFLLDMALPSIRCLTSFPNLPLSSLPYINKLSADFWQYIRLISR